MKPPKTIEQWREYIANLQGDFVLTSKAKAMNSHRFVERLQDEYNMAPGDITQIFRMFAKRLQDAGIAPPSGGYMDLRDLQDEPETQAITFPAPSADFKEPKRIETIRET